MPTHILVVMALEFVLGVSFIAFALLPARNRD